MKTTTIQAHFDDIRPKILRELQQARYNIKAAVAWFTDREILEVLTSKAGEGVAVELILSKVSLNEFDLRPFAFAGLRQSGGEVFQCGAADFREGSIMHNKFAVIDFRTVITGSYNWTNQAQRNEENIVVFRNESQADLFIEKFEALKAVSTILSTTNGEDSLVLTFTCTKNRVDPGQPFELHWEAYNADYVTIDNGIGVVSLKGNREVNIHKDTCFTIEAKGSEEIKRKSIWVRIIRKPQLDFRISYLDPVTGKSTRLRPSSPLLDTYSVVSGMNLTLHWESAHAELVKLDGQEVEPGSGSLNFTCESPRPVTFEAFGIKHRIVKRFTVNPIPLPRLDRLTSPLPGDIQIYSEFDFLKVDLPSSLVISGNALSIRMPNIRQLKARLVGRNFQPSFSPPKAKRADFMLSRRAKENKKRLREHLLATFREDKNGSSFLEKILKRYE